MRSITKLIVHCSATPRGWMSDAGFIAQVDEIRRWHMQERGWRDIGYHLLIGRDGDLLHGRPFDQTGAHVRGHNTGSVGICLIGGHGAGSTDRFGDHFSLAQDTALRAALESLNAVFPNATLHGHSEFAPKGCPGFQVMPWYRREGLWASSVAKAAA